MMTWAQDVLGNAIATAAFQDKAESLAINSVSEIPLDAVAWPVFEIAGRAISHPFRYSDDEWADLGALTIRRHWIQKRDFLSGR